MKTNYFLIALFLCFCSYGQVGINTVSPNAQLEIQSSNQATPANTDGIIIPKIDAFPVINPTAAQNGMMVYLTIDVGSITSGFYYWKNATSSWVNLQGATLPIGGYTHFIGESYLGGIIYYLYKGSDGLEHGLVVSLTEGVYLSLWISSVIQNKRTWDGAYNTTFLAGSQAANYVATLGSSWYIPSIDELNKLYYNRYEINKALFAGGNTLLSKTDNYWSSTNYLTATIEYNLSFLTGQANIDNSSNQATVRGIRSF